MCFSFKKVIGRLVTTALLSIPFSVANAGLITVDLADATNGINFFGQATIEDNGADSVAIEITIADPVNVGLIEGDILAFFFDLEGIDTTTLVASNFQPDEIETTTITTPGGLSGAGGTLNWDVGISTGVGGGKEGKNQTVSFDLAGLGLSTASFGTYYGLRVQSITGTEYMFNGDSSKLTGGPTTDPTPVSSPATVALLGIGMIGMTFVRRRKSAQV